MTQEATTEPAYIAGWNARNQKHSIDACPYPFSKTIQWALWRGGWNDRDMTLFKYRKTPDWSDVGIKSENI